MWPTVSTDEIEERWRVLTDSEKTVATTRIADVEAELRSELRLYGLTATPVLGAPGFLTQDAVDDWEALYVSVVANVVKQSLLNPDGWLEETVQLDDFTRTRRRDKATSSGLVYVSVDDVAKLLPRVRPSRGAFSIRTS